MARRGAGPADAIALAAAIGLLLCVLGPAVGRVAARSDRAACADNLRALGQAAIAYMNDRVGIADRAGFMPHASGVTEVDRPAQVGDAFAQLVRTGHLEDPAILVCPASGDTPAKVEGDRKAFAFRDPDLRSTRAFSYGWAKDQVTDGKTRVPKEASEPRKDRLIAADRTVGDPGGGLRGHEGGRNVLRFDGGVRFVDAAAERATTELQDALDTLNLVRYLREEEDPAGGGGAPRSGGAGPDAAEAANLYRAGVAAFAGALESWAEGVALGAAIEPDRDAIRARFAAAKDGFDAAIDGLGAARRAAPGLDPSIDEMIFTARRYGVACRERLAALGEGGEGEAPKDEGGAPKKD